MSNVCISVIIYKLYLNDAFINFGNGHLCILNSVPCYLSSIPRRLCPLCCCT